VHSTDRHRLVRLANGAVSVHSLAYGETIHPAVGPAAEAEGLYVRQLRLRERLQTEAGEFVIWDVGLGVAANAVTVLRATRDLAARIRLVSFDDTAEPFRFALAHRRALGFLRGFEDVLPRLVSEGQVSFTHSRQSVTWSLHLADFPSLLADPLSPRLPAPHVILFDPYSPAKNPAMWTLDLLTRLFRRTDARRPCALATYSRSTMVRVALLRAGFFVGVGEASGPKEETTIAANSPALLARPLDRRWLERARRSDSAEPLRAAVYCREGLSAESWAALRAHPQFST